MEIQDFSLWLFCKDDNAQIHQEIPYSNVFNDDFSIRTLITDPHYSDSLFANLLKFICNPQINTHSAFILIHRYKQSGKKVESLGAHPPSWGLLSHFSSYTVTSVSLCSNFSTAFFIFLCLLSLISLFKMDPKHSAALLSSAPRCKKATMFLEAFRKELQCC